MLRIWIKYGESILKLELIPSRRSTGEAWPYIYLLVCMHIYICLHSGRDVGNRFKVSVQIFT